MPHWLKMRDVAVRGISKRSSGIEGEFRHPYKTMDFHAEARIRRAALRSQIVSSIAAPSDHCGRVVATHSCEAEGSSIKWLRSDTIWVKFPVDVVPATVRCLKSSLDPTPWHHPRQPCCLLFHPHQYGLSILKWRRREMNSVPQMRRELIFCRCAG